MNMLNVNATYSRINSIVYDEHNVLVVQLKQKFIDIEKLNITTIEYMNRYIQMFPHLVEVKTQLTLF